MSLENSLTEANSNDESCQWLNELLPDLAETSSENVVPDTSTSNTQITPEAVLQLINEVQNDEATKDRISVLPLMCGTGKSSALRLKMKQIIEAGDGSGMIIVTDSIDRMRDYLLKGSEELIQFFAEHKNQITIMKHDTLEENLMHQAEGPILIMSTQRFTNLLPSQTKQYLKWNHGDRNLIIVDERPYFYRQIDISLDNLYQLRAACDGGLPQRGPAAADRKEILEFWDSAFLYLRATMLTMIDKCQKVGQYYFYTVTNWTEADRFHHVFGLMEKYRNYLNQYEGIGTYVDVYSLASGAYQLLKYGALLCVRIDEATLFGRKSYRNSDPNSDKASILPRAHFSVLMNNYYKYHNSGAKVIILDGTADLSPEYQIYPDLDMRTEQCEPYKRSLSRLYIDIIPKRTGKTVLQNNPSLASSVVDDVHDALQRMLPSNQEPVVFSYKFLREKFQNYYHEKYDWFGDIKGKNDYREEEYIAQVGLHRFPQSSYFMLELARFPQLAETLPVTAVNIEGSYEEHSNAILAHINEATGYTQEAAYREILADLEQNLFRGIIRESRSDKDYHFYLFTSTSYNSKLIEMIKQRYEVLGGHVTIHEKPAFDVLKSLMIRGNESNPTRLQRLITWHDKQIALGTLYTYADISKAIQANGPQIRQIRKDNPVIDKLFKEEMFNKEWRTAFFMKKSNWYFPDEADEEDKS